MLIPKAIKEKAEKITACLSLEEKIGQMLQLDGRNSPEFWVKDRAIGSVLHVTGSEISSCQAYAKETSHGIPLLCGIDAIHGHAFHDGASVFPVQLAQGATFNPKIIKEIGRVTAEEVLATGLDWSFAPVLCLGRDPRWGRLSESFGEDAYLTGILGEAYIQGAQDTFHGRKMIACAKHFIAYGESRGGRDSADSPVSKRLILEKFLPPFEKAISAGCLSLMIGYQSIDGIPCTASHWLIKDILIDALGFEGIIITDWDNTGRLCREQGYAQSMKDATKIVLASGCSMVMATEEFYEYALELCNADPSLIHYIDEAVSRNIAVKLYVGLFDESQVPTDFLPDLTLAYEAAVQSFVLLKNVNDVLPLKPAMKVFIAGPQTDSMYNQLGEWSFGPQEFTHKKRRPYHQNTRTLAVSAKGRNPYIQVDTTWGEIVDGFGGGKELDPHVKEKIDSMFNDSAGFDAYVMAVGDSFEMNGECLDRSDLTLTPSQIYAIQVVKSKYPNTPLIAVVIGGKPVVGKEFYDSCDAVLECWNPGLAGGDAILDVLFGLRDAEGRLPISIPRSIGQIPVCYDSLPGWHTNKYIDLFPGPQFPFGFGLSYANCAILNSSLSQVKMSVKEFTEKGLGVSAHIDNTSEDRNASCVLQVYIHDKVASVIQPIMKLVGFQKFTLSPREEKSIMMNIASQEFSFITENHAREIEPGEFDVYIGFSSQEVDCIKHEFVLME